MKKERVLIKAADMFDVPADVKGGLLHIEIESNREVFFENHKGIVSLSEEEVEIKVEAEILPETLPYNFVQSVWSYIVCKRLQFIASVLFV